ncbi:MAG: hypothetical protein ACTSP4_15755 [Candidatus Hodarchaeales archaeon]
MLVDHPKPIKQKMTTMIQWIAYYPAVTTVLVKRMSLTFVCTFLHEKSIILSRNILLAEYFQRIIRVLSTHYCWNMMRHPSCSRTFQTKCHPQASSKPLTVSTDNLS